MTKNTQFDDADMAITPNDGKIPGTTGHLILDRSGSMWSGLDATLEAFNGYFEGLKGTKNMRFSLSTFEGQTFDTLRENVTPGRMVKLTRANFVPSGSTPLFDSIARIIKLVEQEIAVSGNKALIVIQTDGGENSSQGEFRTRLAIKGLIEAKQEEGWQFVFLGVGVDSFGLGHEIGIFRGNVINYDYQPKNMRMMTETLVASTQSYGASSCTGSNDFFNTDGAGVDLVNPTETVGVVESSTTAVEESKKVKNNVKKGKKV